MRLQARFKSMMPSTIPALSKVSPVAPSISMGAVSQMRWVGRSTLPLERSRSAPQRPSLMTLLWNSTTGGHISVGAAGLTNAAGANIQISGGGAITLNNDTINNSGGITLEPGSSGALNDAVISGTVTLQGTGTVTLGAFSGIVSNLSPATLIDTARHFFWCRHYRRSKSDRHERSHHRRDGLSGLGRCHGKQ